MMTANTTEPSFTPGTPRRLFDGIYDAGFPNRQAWDIAPDGERFLMLRNVSSDAQSPYGQITVVLHWFEELTRLVPVD